MRHIGFATQAPHFMIIPEVHQSVNRTPVSPAVNFQSFEAIPEPTTIGLIALAGILGVASLRRFRPGQSV